MSPTNRLEGVSTLTRLRCRGKRRTRGNKRSHDEGLRTRYLVRRSRSGLVNSLYVVDPRRGLDNLSLDVKVF